MTDVIIIGGGASGIACAIELKRLKPEFNITILEKTDKIAKKILASGNGRCNLSNENIADYFYQSSDESFLKSIDFKESREEVNNFWGRLGLLLRVESGRIYPYSNMASTVVDIFKEHLEDNINIIYNFECIKIEKEKDCYKIISKDKTITGKYVVFASGGKSSLAKDNNITYDVLNSIGHEVTTLSPGLTSLKIKEHYLRDIKGQRIKASVKLIKDNKTIKEAEGEVLFTEYGLSGICIMDLSNFITDSSYHISIDLMKEYELSEVKELLNQRIIRSPNQEAKNILLGIINNKVGLVLIKSIIKDINKKISNLNEKEIDLITYTIKNWQFTITEKSSFEASQVTCGGINTKEIDYKTFESKINKNLYIIGELLDIAGLCGGYNLHFAWYSGILAARAINNKPLT